jgi:hypothetical protein
MSRLSKSSMATASLYSRSSGARILGFANETIRRPVRDEYMAKLAPNIIGAMSNWSDEDTDDPVYADRHNFYKVEKWSGDGLRVELMLYAGNSLDKAFLQSRKVERRRAAG